MNTNRKAVLPLLACTAFLAIPFALTGCDKEVSKDKTTTTRTTETPSGTKTTTETTERKVETDPKNPH